MRLLLSVQPVTIRVMELLLATIVTSILGVLAMTIGTDSRDADRSRQTNWV